MGCVEGKWFIELLVFFFAFSLGFSFIRWNHEDDM